METLKTFEAITTITVGILVIENQISNRREKRRQHRAEQEVLRKTEQQRQANRELGILALGALFIFVIFLNS